MRAKEFIAEESHSKFHDYQLGPMTGMKRYDGLDNSNPYAMWRYIVAVAGMPKKDKEFDPTPPLDKGGPIGQKMSTLAYSKADAEILDATATLLGEKGTEISSQESTEPVDTHKVSPVRAFKGYAR
jgi:hypothetical protein